MDLFVTALETGHTIKDSCDFAGVARATVYNALRQGLIDVEEGKKDSVDAQFLDATRHAKARAKFKLVGRVMQAANTDWRAAIAMLERRFPKEWGLVRTTKLGVDDKLPPSTTFTLNFGRGPRERAPDGSVLPTDKGGDE